MEATSPISLILAGKPRGLFSVTPSTTVYDAIRTMADHNIGAVVVLDGDRLEGVFSERDYTRKLILQGRLSRETAVADVLTRPVITVEPSTSVADCMRVMTDNRIRHLPVLEGSDLVGLISIGDCVKWVISQQNAHIEHLERYISGDYPG